MSTPRTASTTDARKRLAEKAADLLDNFEYTLTLRALRQIKAEAWDEGYGDDLDCNTPRTNPYRTAIEVDQ